MKTTKWLVAILLLLSLALSLCACDDDDDNDSGWGRDDKEEDVVKNRIDGWEIEDVSCKIGEYHGKVVYVEFTCTNRNSSAEAFAYDVGVAVYQDGVELDDNHGGTDHDALNKVKAGISVTYEYGWYRLDSETSDIEVEFRDIHGNTYSRTFEIEDCRVEED